MTMEEAIASTIPGHPVREAAARVRPETDIGGGTVLVCADGSRIPADDVPAMRGALEAAEHWLAEEAASPHPGQTRPDDILRVIREALGKPHGATDAAPDEGPEAAPGSIAPLVEFLCVGFYEDDGTRFADTVKAYDAAGAESTAEETWPRVTWAGFVALRDGVMTVEG